MKLLVLAAGMGLRFGGIKQMTAVGPAGETLLEFNLFNARKAGFNHVVFLIKREMEADFRKIIANRLPSELNYEFAYQDILAGVPEPIQKRLAAFMATQGRIKPWGTGHALLCARELLADGIFATINADDFYGAEAFKVTAEFLRRSEMNAWNEKAAFCLPVYQLEKVISRTGSVSRAVVSMDSAHLLKNIIEHTKVIHKEGKIVSVGADGTLQILSPESPVSMNLWGLKPAVFSHAHELFVDFIADESNWEKNEFFLPYIIRSMVENGTATVQVLPVQDACFGLTNPDDLPEVRSRIHTLITSGCFQTPLWGEGT